MIENIITILDVQIVYGEKQSNSLRNEGKEGIGLTGAMILAPGPTQLLNFGNIMDTSTIRVFCSIRVRCNHSDSFLVDDV